MCPKVWSGAESRTISRLCSLPVLMAENAYTTDIGVWRFSSLILSLIVNLSNQFNTFVVLVNGTPLRPGPSSRLFFPGLFHNIWNSMRDIGCGFGGCYRLLRARGQRGSLSVRANCRWGRGRSTATSPRVIHLSVVLSWHISMRSTSTESINRINTGRHVKWGQEKRMRHTIHLVIKKFPMDEDVRGRDFSYSRRTRTRLGTRLKSATGQERGQKMVILRNIQIAF